MKNVCRVSSGLTLALLVATSCSSAFGWWEYKEGEVSITSGNVYITENDKPSAAVTVTVAVPLPMVTVILASSEAL